MNKEQLIQKMTDALTSYYPMRLVMGCWAIDYAIKDYNRLDLSDEDKDEMCYTTYFDDDREMWGAIDGVCNTVSYLRNRQRCPAYLNASSNGMSWTMLLELLGIDDVSLGELRRLTTEGRFSISGLMADVALRNYEQCIGNKTTAIAAALFLARLKDYQASENHYDDNLWYLTYDGKIGKCLYTGENRWATKHLDNEDIIFDEGIGIYVANREINGEGCCFVRQRPILARIGTEWSSDWLSKIEEYFDGGIDCHMIIDQNFEIAYEPTYDDSSSVLDGDFVCGYSCMSGRGADAQRFYGGIEGCYVARFEDADGNQVGRCIVYKFNGQRHFIRLYAKREYQNKANMLIKAEMHENDIRGRDEHIDGLCLPTHWDEHTTNMYLDGNAYGAEIVEGELCVAVDYSYGLKSTSDDYLFEKLGLNRCAHCGKLHRCFYADQDYYCSAACARADGLIKCDECGMWFRPDDGVVIDSKHQYCCSSCARRNGFRQCKHCQDWHYADDMLMTIQGEYYCNEDCAFSDGCRIDCVSKKYTSDYLPTSTGFVDAQTLLMHREKFNIKITRKHNKRMTNETNTDELLRL